MFRERQQIEQQDVRDQINKFMQGGKFVVKNEKSDNVLDANNQSLENIYNVLGTLIKSLQTKSILEK